MNGELLKKYIAESGKKKMHLAERAGVSRPRLDYIIKHPETATLGQAETLVEELTINEDDKKAIFLP